MLFLFIVYLFYIMSVISFKCHYLVICMERSVSELLRETADRLQHTVQSTVQSGPQSNTVKPTGYTSPQSSPVQSSKQARPGLAHQGQSSPVQRLGLSSPVHRPVHSHFRSVHFSPVHSTVHNPVQSTGQYNQVNRLYQSTVQSSPVE